MSPQPDEGSCPAFVILHVNITYEIILNIYHKTNYTLLLSANPDYCRIHLTNHPKPNPQNAPNFCMLLRKHLIGMRISSISNYDLERIISIKLEGYNELNDFVEKTLIIELMGKHSNIIFCNSKTPAHI